MDTLPRGVVISTLDILVNKTGSHQRKPVLLLIRAIASSCISLTQRTNRVYLYLPYVLQFQNHEILGAYYRTGKFFLCLRYKCFVLGVIMNQIQAICSSLGCDDPGLSSR